MPLKLPSDESFAQLDWLGTSTHPVHEWLWVRADPFGRVVSGTVPNPDSEGYLSTAMPGYSLGCSVHANLAGTGTGDFLARSFLSAWSPGEDVEVRASFVRRTEDPTGGGTVDGGFRTAAIMTRAGGTYSTTANAGTVLTEHVEYIDHYLLWLSSSSTEPDAGFTARLLGVTHSSGTGLSGTARQLASHGVTGGIANLDLAAGLDFSIQVENVGGNPTLTCKLYGYTVQGQPTDVTLFDDSVIGGTVITGTDVTEVDGVLTDAHTDKITANGSFGVVSPVSRDDTVGGSAVEVTEGIAFVRVSSVSTGEVVFEDDWDRLAIHVDALAGADYAVVHRCVSIHGNVGAWANSLWSYGGCANTSNTVADVDPLLERSGAAGAAQDHATVHLSDTSPWPSDAPNDREFWSLRPSDYDYTHHRSLQFKPFQHQVTEAGWSTALDTYGILLRGRAQQGHVDRAWCVRLVAIIEDVASVATQTSLYCYLSIRLDTDIDGNVEYLDLWRADLQGTVDLLDGAWHELQYEVHTYEDATDTTAPRIHKAFVDNTQVVFDTSQTWSDGTQVLSNGTVFDNSVFIQTGWLEGFVVESTINETDGAGNDLFTEAQVRNWTQESLTKKTSAVAPQDQASYAWVTDEGASTATGDLNTVVTPTFPFEEQAIGADMMEFEHSTGHRTTRARSTRTRRRYRFEGGPMDQTGINALEAFWESHGVEVPFSFTPDGESTARTCVFLERPTLRFVHAGAWVPQLSIEEVLS